MRALLPAYWSSEIQQSRKFWKADSILLCSDFAEYDFWRLRLLDRRSQFSRFYDVAGDGAAMFMPMDVLRQSF